MLLLKDYVTEKFWRTLAKPVIPVVMGGANYTKEAPPNSFIHVNDFKSVKSLADYLKSLLKDKVLKQFVYIRYDCAYYVTFT